MGNEKMTIGKMIELFRNHDKVTFKLSGFGETELETVEFRDILDTIEYQNEYWEE